MVTARGLLLAIAFLQPISWSARVEDVVAAIEKDDELHQGESEIDTAGKTSDALQEQADRYHALALNQEYLLTQYKLDLNCAQNDLEFKKNEYKQKDWWYKFRYWRLWSEELPRIQGEIDTLKQKIQGLEHTINAAEAELEKHKDSKKRAVVAQSLVEEHQGTIQSLTEQIDIKQQDKELTTAQHAKDMEAAKQLADNNLQLFQDKVAALAAKIAAHDAELQLLEEGNHDVQKEQAKAQAVLQEAITSYQAQIKDLDGQIVWNEQQVAEAEKDRSEAESKYDLTIKQLKKDRFQLDIQKKALEKQLQETQDKLAQITAEKNAEIEQLTADLTAAKDQLTKDILKTRNSLERERLENDANIATLKNQQADDLKRIDSEKKTLEESKNKAVDEIQELSKQVDSSEALSRKIQEGVSDLKVQKQVQEQSKQAALDDISRQQNERTQKQNDLACADKVYKFWYWRIWSSHKAALEEEINFLNGRIAADNDRKDKHEEQIACLTKQIDDAIASLRDEAAMQTEKGELIKAEQENVDKLTAEVNSQVEERKLTVANQDKALQRQEAVNDEELKQFNDMLAKLQAEKTSADGALEKLASGEHDASVALQEVKQKFTTIIANYQTQINELSDSIALMTQKILKEQKAKEEDLIRKDNDLKEQVNQGSKMKKSKAAAEGAMAEEQERHELLTTEHGEDIDALKTIFSDSKMELEATSDKNTDDYKSQLANNEKDLQAKQLKFDEYVNDLDSQIAQLSQTKAEVEGNVAKIQDEHLG